MESDWRVMTATIRDVYGGRSAEFEAFKRSNRGFPAHRGRLPSIALRNLIDLDKILVAASIEYVLLYGTLLGATRDGKLIPHDTDIDVGVIAPSEAAMLKVLSDLEKAGLRVIRVSGPKESLTDFVSVGRGGEYIDISLLRFRRVAGLDFIGQTSGWSRTRNFFPLSILNLEEMSFPAPRESEKLLKRWYGRNWRTPQVGKRANHHRKLRNLLRNLRARIASMFVTKRSPSE